ncbi:MAG TPA: HAMP domain-containing protein [Candidatus Aminicenantes bacterium]|nr:HAMP domain-containing protein [Candidatus Aminicenantes bacterium]
MENSKKKGSRIVGAAILLLIILFIVIESIIRGTQQFSPISVTNILLSLLQIIVILLFLILLFVLGRNLVKLYLERKRKVLGSKFKTKLLVFFISLSLIPTLLLFFFASDLITRNIEQWFKTPIDKILDDTSDLTESFYQTTKDTTLHYARQLGKAIQTQELADPNDRVPLIDFVREKLKEYQLDEISVFLDEEELFSMMNPDLPLQYYRNMNSNYVKRAHLGEVFSTIESMGSGEMIRRGVSIPIPEKGNILVVAGKFLPQNYAQKINSVSAYVKRYRQVKTQKNPVKTFYLLMLVFITLLLVFAASWIGFHLAKSITVPVEKLANATREVSKGNLDIQVQDPASDELGMFIDSFNKMISDLRESREHIQQKTAELQSGKQYIETILNDITTGVITINSDDRITTINPSALKMLALERKNLIGKDYKEVLKGLKYTEIVRDIEKAAVNKHQISDKEITINFNSQNTTLSLTISHIEQDEDGTSGLIIVLDDLTQLIKAQKIAAWKEVAQRVAHEIKNPLTPIQLSAERIEKKIRKRKTPTDQTLIESTKTIIQEARTIKDLIDEFSNFARMPKITLKETNLHEIITQTIAPFQGIFSEIKFQTQFDNSIPNKIKLDKEQMKRALTNIIDNAIDAMNKKGEIEIKTSLDKQYNKIEIEISDTGPGIPEKDKEKLFLPHFSTKKKGTGLGLAIVNQVINEHNGIIRVEDNEPIGTKFIIQVPI